VRCHLTWCAGQEAEPMSRAALDLWIAGLLDGALIKACTRPKGATPKEALRHCRDEALGRGDRFFTPRGAENSPGSPPNLQT
jgi:hypothetical protein